VLNARNGSVSRQVFDNDCELIGFLQRVAGYSATGDTRSQRLVRHVRTERAQMVRERSSRPCVPASKLLQKSFEPELLLDGPTHSMEAPSRSRWRAVGVRAAFMQETKRRRKIDSALVKRLTGGDDVVCVPKHEKTLVPSDTQLWLASNYKPRLRRRASDADRGDRGHPQFQFKIPWARLGCRRFRQRKSSLRPRRLPRYGKLSDTAPTSRSWVVNLRLCSTRPATTCVSDGT